MNPQVPDWRKFWDSILANKVDSIGIPLLSNHTIMTTAKLYSDDHRQTVQWWPLPILIVMTTVYPYSDDHWELALCMGEDTSQQVGSPNFYHESICFLVYHELTESLLSLSSRASIRDMHRHS